MEPQPDTLKPSARRYQPDPTRFPNHIQSLCRERKITQVSLARAMNVIPLTVNRWARGVQSPSWPEIHHLCRLLSCDLCDLVKMPTNKI